MLKIFRRIEMKAIVLSLCLLLPVTAFSCQSPVGTWTANDQYGELKLVFNTNGTGKFFPDATASDNDSFSWKFISKRERKETEPFNRNVETNVLELDYRTPEPLTEYMLCTGNRIVVQFYSVGEILTTQYTREKRK